MGFKETFDSFWIAFKELLARFWQKAKSILRVIYNARISLALVALSALACFKVDQVTDAIIGFGNYFAIHKCIFFTVIGFLWAFQVWYWLRVFYYLEYYEEALPRAEFWLVRHLPRLLGSAALIIIGSAFFNQALMLHRQQISADTQSVLFIIGTIFVLYAVVFYVFVLCRRKIFQIDEHVIQYKHTGKENFMSRKELPPVTRRILYITTGISLGLLGMLLFDPYTLPPKLGASISILFVCFVIWLPVFYWVHYAVRRLHFPVYAAIFILIFIFSFFNGNKEVRILEETANRAYKIYDYYKDWYTARTQKQKGDLEDPRLPLIMVLSEGGGIRAAYWSACLLGRIQQELPAFSKYVFGIQGVSGGSFGAAVFTSLLKWYKEHPQARQSFFDNWEASGNPQAKEDAERKGIYQVQAGRLIGEDYLSPVITAMFTRALVQFLLPVPVDAFDYAKVFEKKWELNWSHKIDNQPFSKFLPEGAFSNPFTSLWENNTDFSVPQLFINSTRVEDGNPFVISPLKLPPIDDTPGYCRLGLTHDFYDYTDGNDIRISTAALLSARFPYVGPAGIVYKNKRAFGFVDGGYFDNSGANLAHEVFTHLKEEFDKEHEHERDTTFEHHIRPVVIYLKNGTESPDKYEAGQSLVYQLLAPTDTLFQVRDASTVNALLKLEEFIMLSNGEFIVFTLQRQNDEGVPIPLGWTLSSTVQKRIDKRIEEIARSEDLAKLKGILTEFDPGLSVP